MMPDDKVNEKHATSPEVGDYWHEMLCGIQVVLAVKDDSVTVCRKKITDADGWSWDYSKIEKVSRADFAKYPRYGSIKGFWCGCVPRKMAYCRDEALAHLTEVLS